MELRDRRRGRSNKGEFTELSLPQRGSRDLPLPLGEVAAVRLTERVPSQSRSLTVPAPPEGEPRVLR